MWVNTYNRNIYSIMYRKTFYNTVKKTDHLIETWTQVYCVHASSISIYITVPIIKEIQMKVNTILFFSPWDWFPTVDLAQIPSTIGLCLSYYKMGDLVP